MVAFMCNCVHVQARWHGNLTMLFLPLGIQAAAKALWSIDARALVSPMSVGELASARVVWECYFKMLQKTVRIWSFVLKV